MKPAISCSVKLRQVKCRADVVDGTGKVLLGIHQRSVQVEDQVPETRLDEFLFLLEANSILFDKLLHDGMITGIQLCHRAD